MKNKLYSGMVGMGIILMTSGFTNSNSSPSFLTPVSPSSTIFNSDASAKETPLPGVMAFEIELAHGENQDPHLNLTPKPGYLIYEDSFKMEGATIVKMPETISHFDEISGTTRQVVSEKQPLFFSPSTTHSVSQITFHYQGCQEKGICYPPMSKTIESTPNGNGTYSFAWSSAAPLSSSSNTAKEEGVSLADDQKISQTLQNKSFVMAVLTFLGLGILLGLTPCVLPMVPILTAMIAGQKNTSTRKSITLSSTYILAHACVFAVMGIAAGLIGSGLNAVFQNPIALSMMALVLGGLGIAMMQAKSIQMPAFIQQWAGQKGSGGSYKGVAMMGALSSLMVGPCVAPPLAGAVLYLSSTGDVWLGGAALFALGLGMGVPMLIAATSMKQWVQKLNGKWSERITRLMGLAMIVVGVSMVARFWSSAWLLAPLLIVLSWPMKKNSIVNEKQKTSYWNTTRISGVTMAMVLGVAGTLGMGMMPQQTDEATFVEVHSDAELEKVLISSKKANQTVVVDFYADWCSECKNMESKTFSDKGIQEQMETGQMTLIKVDVTQNNEEHQDIMKKYQLMGPPAILFFNNGEEVRKNRLIGFENKEKFGERIKNTLICSKTEEEKQKEQAVC